MKTLSEITTGKTREELELIKAQTELAKKQVIQKWYQNTTNQFIITAALSILGVSVAILLG